MSVKRSAETANSTAGRLRLFGTKVKDIIPEGGRAEAGTGKKWLHITMIRGRRPQLQGVLLLLTERQPVLLN